MTNTNEIYTNITNIDISDRVIFKAISKAQKGAYINITFMAHHVPTIRKIVQMLLDGETMMSANVVSIIEATIEQDIYKGVLPKTHDGLVYTDPYIDIWTDVCLLVKAKITKDIIRQH